MITTLTPNPSLDRTVTLPGALVRGGVNRVTSLTTEPGGKGVNVARVLASAGLDSQAVLPTGPNDLLTQALRALPPPRPAVWPVQVSGAARVNTAVTEPDGTTTKINEPGNHLGADALTAVEQTLLDAVEPTTSPKAEAGWAVLSGSLPPGAPTTWYGRLVGLLRAAAPGTWVAVDTSDAPLTALARALPHGAPDLIKPNGEELGQLAGLSGEQAGALEAGARRGDLTPVVEAAHKLVAQGVREVMATLGPAGAVLVSAVGAWHATAPEVAVVSTVGAGDSSVAGYVLAATQGADEAERLATAMAYGAAATSLPGTTLPTPADLPAQAAVVTRLD